jgi:DNA-binding LacI/PurR family transcriptional regulator
MPTIKEIAYQTGFSASTVSVVLSGKAEERKIPESTREIILNSARELGYTPNISARRLRNNQYKNRIVIGVFWATDFRASMVVRFLRGLQKEIAGCARGCEIIIRPYTNGTLPQDVSLTEMNMFNAAIICNASAADIEFLEKNTFQIPIVLYNRRSTKYCSVNVDNSKMGTLSAEVFISHGRKRAAVITSEPVFSDMTLRDESFLGVFENHGHNAGNIIIKENSMKGGYEGAKEIAAMNHQPDCLFCASDAIALGALKAFAQSGIRVPEDIEIISVGNGEREAEEYASTSLSVAYVPIEKMAELCFKTLLDVTDGKIEPPFSVDLPVEYIAWESCGEKR